MECLECTGRSSEIVEEFKQFCKDKDYEQVEHYLSKYLGLSTYDDHSLLYGLIPEIDDVTVLKLLVKYGVRVEEDNYWVLFELCRYKGYKCLDYIQNTFNIDDKYLWDKIHYTTYGDSLDEYLKQKNARKLS